MKWCNKSKLVGITLRLLLFTCATSFSCVNGYQNYHGGFPFNPWVNHHQLGGSRITEQLKAASYPLPLHYSNQGSLNFHNDQAVRHSHLNSNRSPVNPSTSGTEIKPATMFSGYYYSPESSSHLGPHSMYPSYLPSPTNNVYQSLSPYPPYQYQPQASAAMRPPLPPPRFSKTQVISPASTDTYKEALDLFSEVVKKLEKETGQGFQQSSSHPSYPTSNGILGSSGALLPPTISAGGFPHHLDHIMGPEFLQKAEKLYYKIMKEQNAKLFQQQQQQGQSSNQYLSTVRHLHGSPNYPYHLGNVPHHYYNGFPNTFAEFDHFARSMIVDSNKPASSLVETLKSVEVSVPYKSSRKDHPVEMMETSESINTPVVSPSHLNTKVANNASETKLSSTTEVSTTTETFKLVDGSDFVEHPLPYNEYEGLVKEIAANHYF